MITAIQKKKLELPLLAFGIFLVLLGAPDLALAQAAFQQGAATFKSNLVSILTPVCGIAVIALAIFAWIGKIAWGWVVSAIIGIVLFFGHEQFISWIRSAFSV